MRDITTGSVPDRSAQLYGQEEREMWVVLGIQLSGFIRQFGKLVSINGGPGTFNADVVSVVGG